MNRINRAYIMAHLVNHGKIHHQDLVNKLGISTAGATNAMRDFQELHGRLNYHTRRNYHLPPDYDTTVPLDHVENVVEEIIIYLAKEDV